MSMTTLLDIDLNMELTELHRLLVDKEAGLHKLGLTTATNSTNTNQATSNRQSSQVQGQPVQNRQTRSRPFPNGPPPSPCHTCGENHWSFQCPVRQANHQGNQSQPPASNQSSTPSNSTLSSPHASNNNNGNQNVTQIPDQNPRPYGKAQGPCNMWNNNRPPPPCKVGWLTRL
ncbi:hypothetical protein M231_00885 [Tremella mesenterica]|uniref:Uncharacterized protein n=1 Tax=Tremella mesenterica TaxID=5217 RepID=A0A4Q1BV53_TREME|nr:hypothetical protein M231_00885 [Tremella mesenterica]